MKVLPKKIKVICTIDIPFADRDTNKEEMENGMRAMIDWAFAKLSSEKHGVTNTARVNEISLEVLETH